MSAPDHRCTVSKGNNVSSARAPPLVKTEIRGVGVHKASSRTLRAQ